MADYNHVILVGRIDDFPVMHKIDECRTKASFNLSVNRPYKDSNGNDVFDFFNVVAWGKLAEVICEYFKKGDALLVDGRIQTRSYEQDGGTKWITEIIAENVSMLGKKTK